MRIVLICLAVVAGVDVLLGNTYLYGFNRGNFTKGYAEIDMPLSGDAVTAYVPEPGTCMVRARDMGGTPTKFTVPCSNIRLFIRSN